MDFSQFSSNSEICRTCLVQLDDSTRLVSLDTLESDAEQHPIRHKLSECLPDLDLSVTPHAAICSNCLYAINFTVGFKRACLQTEADVQSYARKIGLAHVKLIDLIHENLVKPESEDITIKDEPFSGLGSNLQETGQQQEESFEAVAIKNEVAELENSIRLCTDKAGDYNEESSDFVCRESVGHVMPEAELVVVHQPKEQATNVAVNFKGKKYKCTKCEYSGSRQGHLNEHRSTHTGVKPHKCTLCVYSTNKKYSLMVHMRTHTGETPFKCDLCDYSGKTKAALTFHSRIHTKDRPYNCAKCDYSTTCRYSLVLHTRTHTGVKPYKCRLCAYRATRKNALSIHMSTHTGDKPFKCDLCDYSAAIKSHLVAHLKTHNGFKPFQCGECEYKCARKAGLELHMFVHTGEKPHCCSECEYKSSRRDGLARHMRIHTGYKPFQCTHCTYRCNDQGNLKRHMKVHNG